MKKRKTAFTLLTASALLLSPFSAFRTVSADVVTDDNNDEDLYNWDYEYYTSADEWEYTVLDSYEGICDTPCIELGKYIGNDTYIHLPNEIDGLPVVSVKGPIEFNQYGSYYNYSYAELFIPPNIKHFEDGWVTPSEHLSIQDKYGDSYSFDYDYFSDEPDAVCLYCSFVTDRNNIIIPETVGGFPVEMVRSGAFSACYSTYSISLPDTIKNIEFLTYDACQRVKKIRLPANLKMIPPEAFRGMDSLEEIEFPKVNYYIAEDAVSEKAKVELPKEHTVRCIYDMYYANKYFIYDPEHMWCYIFQLNHDGTPDTATLIYAPDLEGDAPTEFMGLPVTVDIGAEPPYGIPVITVGKNETMLTPTYASKEDVEELRVFSNDITITSPGIPLSQIKELSFPGSVDLCTACFSSSPKLCSVTFNGEDSEIRLGCYSFYDNPLLKTVIFPKSCKKLYIEDTSFAYSNVQNLDFPDGKVTIEESAFNKCRKLSDISFPDGVKVDEYAFNDCVSLTDITFRGTSQLGKSVFMGCSALKNINIDPTLDLNAQVFKGCTNLETINGETPFNSDGSPKAEYKDFIEKNFYASENNGIVNKYVDYRVKKTVSETVTDDMNDMQKLKALHDKLCDMVYYDTENTALPKNHNDASVFLNESSVCDGYARAMNLLLHEAGINSCYVSNNDHAWVIAEIGGHYFHVDPTWDDMDTIIYDWFLRTDDQITFDKDHSEWKLTMPSAMHSFQWDYLPACEEKMGDVNSDGIVDGRDATDILTAYAKAAVGAETEIDSVLADVDFSGRITAADASKVLTEYAKESAESDK